MNDIVSQLEADRDWCAKQQRGYSRGSYWYGVYEGMTVAYQFAINKIKFAPRKSGQERLVELSKAFDMRENRKVSKLLERSNGR